MFNRMDLSITQDVFKNIGGKRNAGQFRFDITNFGNLLNHDWGVSQRTVASTTAANGAQILTTPSAADRCAGPPALSNGRRQQPARDQVVPDNRAHSREATCIR